MNESSAQSITACGVWTDFDLHLFNEGNHFHLYRKLGAFPRRHEGESGVYFSVWAPNAHYVSVIGEFNNWDRGAHPMTPVGYAGIWEAFIPGAQKGERYKYYIASRINNYSVAKADPFASWSEAPPQTASVVWETNYQWRDAEWMSARGARQTVSSPISIYELHLGSWKRKPEEGDRFLTYRELAAELPEYAAALGFTHVELMPVMEHPFGGSWGYQVTGYFAASARFGPPEDLMFLIDALHQRGIGVILDWVPAHFPSDEHGLVFFDGTHLFEHADPRQGFHPQWTTNIFNYERHEVRSFLISSAMSWLDRYHADGLRVDGVESMLYLDYGRNAGEWIPNEFGGRENLGAVRFLKRLNEAVYGEFPDIITIAEESTSWPGVTRPVFNDGLGFGYKWDMGWMHDSLRYFKEDPLFRKGRHNDLTFRMLYAWTENFVLALSHDEVVHGKRSLLNRMPGDRWQQFANLRLLFAYMYGVPGKKLIFMGGEFGQWNEWWYERSLDWHLIQDPLHAGVMKTITDLNRLYQLEPALHRNETLAENFEWIDCDDAANSTLTLLRKGETPEGSILVVFNFTPVLRTEFRVGAPWTGVWQEVFNSDSALYGGSNAGNEGKRWTGPTPMQGREQSLKLTLPPLGAVFLRYRGLY